MQKQDNTAEIVTDKQSLRKIFISGCKNYEKIGVESEKLLIYKTDKTALKYEDAAKILSRFKGENISENGNIIGVKADFGTLSLEPGSQIEISLNPFKTIKEISDKLIRFYTDLANYASDIGAFIYNSGIQCVSTFDNIKVIPKKRYEYMTNYLPTQGLTPYIMMRETAGIQVNFDYKSEEDATKKLSTALKMSSIVAAIYSNSPLRNSKNTGFKSFRAYSWLNVDEERCGLVNRKLFEKNNDFSFDNYIDILLNIPMIFIKRGNEYYPTNITFKEFMQNGFKGFKATVDDWETHLSLFFPDVRLKSYIEIRNHDAQNTPMTLSVPAFWKGIMYNPDAMSEINEILSKYTYDDFVNLREEMPKYGIDAKLGNIKIIDYVREFFDISAQSLKSNGENEEQYLEPVFEYIKTKHVPADFIKQEI